ncbi:hypothetical protein CEXT_747671 [Caerostris extrusa]|uniref:Uncharacterized protein n=1 Tax=Caerostris extrusa TaxID=172846 RepID=A0AAV4T6V3_CAEEX|nr:hypothetical protein CEXT_747671 [Caerostris extrusa]
MTKQIDIEILLRTEDFQTQCRRQTLVCAEQRMTEKEATGTVTGTFKRMICDPHGNPMLAHTPGADVTCQLSTAPLPSLLTFTSFSGTHTEQESLSSYTPIVCSSKTRKILSAIISE